MAKYSLTYFEMPARAEVHRLTLAVGGANWEDVRLPMDKWPAKKAELEASTAENFRFPWLPQLEVHDNGSKMVVSQSLPALRMLARKFGLDGGSEAEKVMVDSILDLYSDFLNGYSGILFSKTPDAVAQDFAKVVNTTGKYLDTILSISKSGYLVGSKMTVADIAIYSVLREATLAIAAKSKHTVDLSKLPKLKAHHEKMAAEPKIKAYYK